LNPDTIFTNEITELQSNSIKATEAAGTYILARVFKLISSKLSEIVTDQI